MAQKEPVPVPPSPPAPERTTPLPPAAPGSSAVARLVRALRALPPSERWPGPGSAGLAGWLQAEAAPPVDVTPRFHALHRRVREGEPVLPAEARRHLYLLVKGMLGDEVPGYLLDNQQRLERRGLETREVAVNTAGRLLDNVAVVREALLDAAHFRRTVVLVGHSKGAVEALSTLALHPELRPQVRAVVSLQAPYGGSVIANDVVTTPGLRRLVDMAYLTLFQGHGRSVEDLSYASRRELVRHHPYPAGIPTVALATSRLSRRSVVGPLARYVVARYGWPSDGLVSAVDAEVPGARVVRLDDMDHAESVLLGLPGFSNYHPGDITEALVALALDTRP